VGQLQRDGDDLDVELTDGRDHLVEAVEHVLGSEG
jgi:hypothetical protein